MSRILALALESAARQLRNDECGMTEEEMEETYERIQMLMDGRITKYEACDILNISRSTFDRIVERGDLPKGMPNKGGATLYWNKADIVRYKKERKKG